MTQETKALARTTDPVTSHDAATSLDESEVTRLEKIVEEAILSTGKNGATWDELHRQTGLRHGSISPRFKPLCEKERIYSRNGPDDKPIRRAGESGRGQIVWYHITTRCW